MPATQQGSLDAHKRGDGRQLLSICNPISHSRLPAWACMKSGDLHTAQLDCTDCLNVVFTLLFQICRSCAHITIYATVIIIWVNSVALMHQGLDDW